MTYLVSKTRGLVPLASAIALLACSAQAPIEQEELSSEERPDVNHVNEATTKAYQAELVRGLTPVQGRLLEQRTAVIEAISIGSNSERPAWADTPLDRSAPGPDQHYTAGFVDAETGVQGLLEYDIEALEALGELAQARALTEPVRGEISDVADAELDDKSWSNAMDSRKNLSTRTGAQYDRVGMVRAAGGCTGTLVGRRLALTAAHCIIDKNGNYIAGTFTPDETPTSARFGTQRILTAYYGGKYLSCSNWKTCVPEDWAILILEDNFHNPSGNYAHPGWQGLKWHSDESKYTELYTAKRVHGYPGCDGPGAPVDASCVYPSLYGQTFDCTIGDFMYPFSDGYNSTFSHGCDASPGMSGSAVQDTDVNRVLGIQSVSRCWNTSNDITCANETNSAIKKNPSLAKRIDSFITNLVITLKLLYP